jgi:hypothetical protein
MNDENIALLAVTSACCEALGKEVQPAFLADEIEELRKRLADAMLVEVELREKCAELEAICKAASQEACTLGAELDATKADEELRRLGYQL